ncbi:MAG: DNA-3-methyladenine glycosylase I [Cypionkella sp.]
MTDLRCAWCGTDPLYVAYHDSEWGRPVRDPRALFECLMLEAFQAGLSWYTILKRRETFRAAFADFDPNIIAAWGEADTLRLLGDTGIIRHRGKIEAVITGAKSYLRIEAREGFSDFLWALSGPPVNNRVQTGADVPAQTPTSLRMSRTLKAEGFKFCGPTICYAFMQAVGMVNDHLVTCPQHGQAQS